MRATCFLAALATLAWNEVAADDAVRANYLLACRGCHLADGSGVPPEVPSLRNTLGQFASTAEGRTYLVRVPGVLQSRLDDDQLTQVINWVLMEFNSDVLPDEFEPLTTDEVATARRQILADPMKFRRTRLIVESTLE
jgi:hypothetical protein